MAEPLTQGWLAAAERCKRSQRRRRSLGDPGLTRAASPHTDRHLASGGAFHESPKPSNPWAMSGPGVDAMEARLGTAELWRAHS